MILRQLDRADIHTEEHVTGLKVRDSETAGLGPLKIPAQDCPVCCISLASGEIPAKLKGYFILCGTGP